jgi:hypothetical protein
MTALLGGTTSCQVVGLREFNSGDRVWNGKKQDQEFGTVHIHDNGKYEVFIDGGGKSGKFRVEDSWGWISLEALDDSDYVESCGPLRNSRVYIDDHPVYARRVYINGEGWTVKPIRNGKIVWLFWGFAFADSVYLEGGGFTNSFSVRDKIKQGVIANDYSYCAKRIIITDGGKKKVQHYTRKVSEEELDVLVRNADVYFTTPYGQTFYGIATFNAMEEVEVALKDRYVNELGMKCYRFEIISEHRVGLPNRSTNTGLNIW